MWNQIGRLRPPAVDEIKFLIMMTGCKTFFSLKMFCGLVIIIKSSRPWPPNLISYLFHCCLFLILAATFYTYFFGCDSNYKNIFIPVNLYSRCMCVYNYAHLLHLFIFAIYKCSWLWITDGFQILHPGDEAVYYCAIVSYRMNIICFDQTGRTQVGLLNTLWYAEFLYSWTKGHKWMSLLQLQCDELLYCPSIIWLTIKQLKLTNSTKKIIYRHLYV